MYLHMKIPTCRYRVCIFKYIYFLSIYLYLCLGTFYVPKDLTSLPQVTLHQQVEFRLTSVFVRLTWNWLHCLPSVWSIHLHEKDMKQITLSTNESLKRHALFLTRGKMRWSDQPRALNGVARKHITVESPRRRRHLQWPVSGHGRECIEQFEDKWSGSTQFFGIRGCARRAKNPNGPDNHEANFLKFTRNICKQIV